MIKKPIILGIESSCDETAASVITENEGGIPTVLSNVISSQTNVHKEFGGVVPELAARSHMEKIDFIVNIPSTSTLEKYVGMLYDEYQIRRKSLELGIPVLTTPELSESFVKTLEWLQTNETTKKPLQPYEN